jgi:hypothetical protein
MAFTLKLTGTIRPSNRNDHWVIDRFVTPAMGGRRHSGECRGDRRKRRLVPSGLAHK